MERHGPSWAELDTYFDPPADRQALMFRPAVNFEYGERYIVALRNLKDASGGIIPAGEAFRRFRDRRPNERAAARSRGKGRPFRVR